MITGHYVHLWMVVESSCLNAMSANKDSDSWLNNDNISSQTFRQHVFLVNNKFIVVWNSKMEHCNHSIILSGKTGKRR